MQFKGHSAEKQKMIKRRKKSHSLLDQSMLGGNSNEQHGFFLYGHLYSDDT